MFYLKIIPRARGAPGAMVFQRCLPFLPSIGVRDADLHGHVQVFFRVFHLGPSWGHLGPSWAIWGPSWAILGPSWGHLGPSWAILGHLMAILRPSWGISEPSWGDLGPEMAPSDPQEGPSRPRTNTNSSIAPQPKARRNARSG